VSYVTIQCPSIIGRADLTGCLRIITWAVKPDVSTGGSRFLSPAMLSWPTSLTDNILDIETTLFQERASLYASRCISKDFASRVTLTGAKVTITVDSKTPVSQHTELIPITPIL
jgi:hypothetical protein